jgi:RNA-binding protein
MPQTLRPEHDLTSKQRKFLRSLGHNLTPVVQMGQKGMTDALVKKVVDELQNHELIKVKIGQGTVASINESGAELATQTGSHLAQALGRTVLLYRRRKRDAVLRLP